MSTEFNRVGDQRPCQVCEMKTALGNCKADANFIAGFAAACLTEERECEFVMCDEHAGLLQYYLDATYIEPIHPQATPIPDRSLN